MLGVASDGSGMTTFLYFEPFIGLGLVLLKSLLKLINAKATQTVSANGDQWIGQDGHVSYNLHATVSRMISYVVALPGPHKQTAGFVTEPISTFHSVVEATKS